CETLVHELSPAVDQACDLGAVDAGPLGHVGEIGLVVLAEVGRVCAGDAAALTHPRDGCGGVQPAREGDADALAGGHAVENSGHRGYSLRSACRLRALCSKRTGHADYCIVMQP